MNEKLEQARRASFTVINSILGALWYCAAALSFSTACASDSGTSRDKAENASEREDANPEEVEGVAADQTEVSNDEDSVPTHEEFDEDGVVEKGVPTNGGDPVRSQHLPELVGTL